MTKEQLSLDNKALKKRPFKTPEDYFDNFPQKITQQLNEQTKIKHKKHIHYFIYVAAAVMMLLLAVPLFLKQHANQSTTEDYELYLYSQLDQNTYYYLLSNL